jgi:hypothetical protein
MKTWWYRWTHVHILLLILFLPGCGLGTGLEYTIPDNYSGFLVIEYDCTNGELAERRNGRVHITFQANGVACLAESYEAIFPSGAFYVAQVQTQSGATIRFQGPVQADMQGYALTDLSMIQQRTGPSGDVPPDFTIGILWVGDVEELAALMQEDTYEEALATFLEQELGISRRIGEPRRQP